LPPREHEAFHASGASTGAFPGANVPSMKSFEPLPWSDYFDAKQTVAVGESGLRFNVYTAGLEAAAASQSAEGEEGAPKPLLYCIHGGGYTGLTWALLAKRLSGKYAVAAVDLRGHGESSRDGAMSFAIEELTRDAVAVWAHLFGAARPPTVVLGHSLGGAVAIHASSLEGIPSLAATVVIDVVEGTAMQSLPYMLQVINRRPKAFDSVQHFVKYAYSSGLTKNFEAARVSAASQVMPGGASSSTSGSSKEERQGGFVWVTDLTKTEPYWKGWYSGLSKRFLGVPVPKLLLLAGTDRLDKDLTIGQMQGKFQMKVLPAGHAIHEDEPDKFCEALDGFLTRFRIA